LVFLSQSYYGIHINIQKNTTYLVLLKLRGKKDVNSVLADFDYIDDKSLLYHMYLNATKEKFSCFIIDIQRQEYRINLLGKYLLKREKNDEDGDFVSVVGVSDNEVVADTQMKSMSVQSAITNASASLARLLTLSDASVLFSLTDGNFITILPVDNKSGSKENAIQEEKGLDVTEAKTELTKEIEGLKNLLKNM
jgi:hypothetical protein